MKLDHRGFGLICGRTLDKTIQPLVSHRPLDPWAVFHDGLFARECLVNAVLHRLPEREATLSAKERADRAIGGGVFDAAHHRVDCAAKEGNLGVEGPDEFCGFIQRKVERVGELLLAHAVHEP